MEFIMNSACISVSINPDVIIYLDFMQNKFINNLSCINVYNIVADFGNNINSFFSLINNGLSSIIIDNYTSNIHTKGLIKFYSCHDYNYNRFIYSCKRMVEHIVINNISINNADDIFITNPHTSLVYTNINHLNMGYCTIMSYIFYTYIKAHFAYYIALIYILITYLFGSIFSIRLPYNRFSLYLFLLILQANPVLSSNFQLANRFIFAIGWFIYINIMAVYDIMFKNIQFKHSSQSLFIHGNINFKLLSERLLLGIIFAFVINIGVLFSNSFYNITIPYLTLWYKVIAIILSFIVSTLASTGWLYATIREMLGFSWPVIVLSYIRSLCESLAFLSLSYANYIIWGLLPQTRVTYLASFIIGLLSYLFFSFFQVMFETDLTYRYLYGFLYNFVFTSLSMSSSGLYFLMNFIHMNIWLSKVLMILCMINIILLPLEVYRYNRPRIILGQRNNNPTLIRYLTAMLYQLIVFFSFAIGTFIWLYLAGLTI